MGDSNIDWQSGKQRKAIEQDPMARDSVIAPHCNDSKHKQVSKLIRFCKLPSRRMLCIMRGFPSIHKHRLRGSVLMSQVYTLQEKQNPDIGPSPG
jgi:hypothetical protein